MLNSKKKKIHPSPNDKPYTRKGPDYLEDAPQEICKYFESACREKLETVNHSFKSALIRTITSYILHPSSSGALGQLCVGMMADPEVVNRKGGVFFYD